MKTVSIKRGTIIIIIGWLLSSLFYPVQAENGDFQSTGNVIIYAMAMEGENIYIAGSASNYAGSLQPGALNLSGGMKDIYLAKYDLAGNLLFEALIGGDNDDSAFDVVVQQGVLYVLGETWSQNFPGAPGNAGEDDAIVLAVAADGSQIQWARRVGGSDQDSGRAIAIQGESLYLTGISWSSDLLPGEAKGNADAFLAKMDLTGRMDWLKVFGGSGLDAPYDLAVSSDRIWVTGQTFSNNFGAPVRGGGDIFATRFNQDGSIEFTGLYGSRQGEIGFSIVLGDDGGFYISGATQSADLPSAIGNYSGGFDGLLLKIESDGSLDYASYLGGSGIDYGYAVGMLPNGDVLVGGMTGSPLFPLGFSDELPSLGGNDAFVVLVNATGQIVDAWQIGGSQDDRATEFLITSSGLWLTGQFSDQTNPFLSFLSLDNMGDVILPTNQPPLPTATRAVTATPFPTETPIPTITNTPAAGTVYPSATETATSTATQTETTISSGNEVPSEATSTNEVGDHVNIESEETPADISPDQDSEEAGGTLVIPIIAGLSLIVLVIVFVFRWRSTRI
jgi:hypothetical protein